MNNPSGEDPLSLVVPQTTAPEHVESVLGQQGRRPGSAPSPVAGCDQGTVGRELVQALRQLVDGNAHCARNGAALGHLLGLADINQNGLGKPLGKLGGGNSRGLAHAGRFSQGRSPPPGERASVKRFAFLLLLLTALAWPQTSTLVAVDGVVCGSQFLDPKVNHPTGGEFNRGGVDKGLREWNDLKTETVVRTDDQERIVEVEGAILTVDGVLLAKKGEPESTCRKRARILKNPIDSRYGKIAWKLKVQKGMVLGVSATLKP